MKLRYEQPIAAHWLKVRMNVYIACSKALPWKLLSIVLNEKESRLFWWGADHGIFKINRKNNTYKGVKIVAR